MDGNYQQLMLFPETTYEERLRTRISALEDKLDRQRKSQFGKIGKLQKCYDELHNEFETLKEAMCRYNLHVNVPCEILEIKTM